jgi:hypothetical protein
MVLATFGITISVEERRIFTNPIQDLGQDTAARTLLSAGVSVTLVGVDCLSVYGALVVVRIRGAKLYFNVLELMEHS